MLETIIEFFVEIVFGEVFGKLFRFIQGIGLRIYSLFVGASGLSTTELRDKYDDKALPWFLGFLVLGTAVSLLVLILSST